MALRYYKVPLENGVFQGVQYEDIVEGIAFQKHADTGFGFIATEATYAFEEVTEAEFNAERMG